MNRGLVDRVRPTEFRFGSDGPVRDETAPAPAPATATRARDEVDENATVDVDE